MRILVVEDDRKVASFIRKGLEEEGHTVDVAPDGEDALEELLARVRALLRRGGERASAVLRVGDLTLDPATREVRRGTRRVSLTAREYTLLEYFMRSAGRVLSRSMLAQHVWGLDFDPESNVVDVYVGYLRRRIQAGGEPKLLHTVRGAGYVLRED